MKIRNARPDGKPKFNKKTIKDNIFDFIKRVDLTDAIQRASTDPVYVQMSLYFPWCNRNFGWCHLNPNGITQLENHTRKVRKVYTQLENYILSLCSNGPLSLKPVALRGHFMAFPSVLKKIFRSRYYSIQFIFSIIHVLYNLYTLLIYYIQSKSGSIMFTYSSFFKSQIFGDDHLRIFGHRSRGLECYITLKIYQLKDTFQMSRYL